MVYSTMLYRIQMINSNSRLTSFKLTPFSWYKAGATPMTLTVSGSGSFQWRGKHYQIIFQTLLNKWLAVYVISIITIVLYMIVIGGIISIILCWFPWYYVNANKCTEGRRSTHFIQFRGSLHSVYRLHSYLTYLTRGNVQLSQPWLTFCQPPALGCVIWCLADDPRCLESECCWQSNVPILAQCKYFMTSFPLEYLELCGNIGIRGKFNAPYSNCHIVLS